MNADAKKSNRQDAKATKKNKIGPASCDALWELPDDLETTSTFQPHLHPSPPLEGKGSIYMTGCYCSFCLRLSAFICGSILLFLGGLGVLAVQF